MPSYERELLFNTRATVEYNTTRRIIIDRNETTPYAEDPGIDAVSARIGVRIRTARQERGMTLAQLGGDDFSRSYLSAMERGKCRASVRALTILARRLGLPVSHFVYGCDGMNIEQPENDDRPATPLTVGVRVEQRSATEVALILDITPRTAVRAVPFPGERSA